MPPQLRTLAIAALGGAAVFDTELDLTWIVDPHLAAVENFGVTGITAIPIPSLPGIVLATGTGCIGSEMGSLRTVKGVSTTSVANTPPFTNLGGIGFWSGTEVPVATADNGASQRERPAGMGVSNGDWGPCVPCKVWRRPPFTTTLGG